MIGGQPYHVHASTGLGLVLLEKVERAGALLLLLDAREVLLLRFPKVARQRL